METSVALKLDSEGITFKLDHEGLQGMCLGEKRTLIMPEKRIRSLFTDMKKRKELDTVLNIELIEINNKKWEKLAEGLQMVMLEEVSPESCERIVINGDTLAVEYEGSLEDGTVFDSSASRGQPFGPFQQGYGQIIRGYEIALAGRCLGERFKMIVPPHLAYGDQGAGDLIPPGATLHFDVRLVQLNQELWAEQQSNQEVYTWETINDDYDCEHKVTYEDNIYMHYLAVSGDDTEFGTLAEVDGEPFGPFRLDGSELQGVPGLGPAMEGMCLGEERIVTLPPRLGWEQQYETLDVNIIITQINEHKFTARKDEL
eukprot:TRINITY_DN82074_c0_g1_i1.p1 TRINITY_DN82074_c0_g1~~TRINITY_DN82074_c0_g1_i1.p1  ORF type:complete len:367 (-),score=59.08 TRINITY_DN82074_c0_g1_i1:43-984(-)